MMSEFKKLAFSGLVLEGGASLYIIVQRGTDLYIIVQRETRFVYNWCGKGPDLCIIGAGGDQICV